MKIKQINDTESIINTVTLSRVNEHDYRLVIKLNSNPTIHHTTTNTILLQQFEYRGLNRTVQTARIDLDFNTTYDWYTFKEGNVLAIIFYNNMKTRLLNEVK
jgi:hypothetical protein